ncbi:MAG: hypothetical protein ABL999_00800 [Pyrinomonadaceae bacterium]
MITKLNLSTHPFRNRVLPYLFAGLLLVMSVFAGVYCIAKLRENSSKNELLAKAIQERQADILKLKGEGEKVQQLLSPDQKAMLSASHKLVANKTFGWSRLFADLEQVLPGSVSASRIAVENIYQDGDRIKAELELGVISRDYPAIQAMIVNMNNSGLFLAELRGQDLQKNERVTFTEYTFRLIYTPGYGYSTATPSTETAQNFQGGNAQ